MYFASVAFSNPMQFYFRSDFFYGLAAATFICAKINSGEMKPLCGI